MRGRVTARPGAMRPSPNLGCLPFRCLPFQNRIFRFQQGLLTERTASGKRRSETAEHTRELGCLLQRHDLKFGRQTEGCYNNVASSEPCAGPRPGGLSDSLAGNPSTQTYLLSMVAKATTSAVMTPRRKVGLLACIP